MRHGRESSALVVIVAGLIACGSLCQREEEPTADLHLVLAKSGKHLFNPAPSPDGRLVYFIQDSTYDSTVNGPFDRSGEVWLLDTVTGQDRLVLAGACASLALSSDGSRLAATGGRLDTALIFIADTSGLLDSIIIPPVPDYGAFGEARFSSAGDAVFYNIIRFMSGNGADTTRFYRRGLAGDTTTALQAQLPYAFTRFSIARGDTIVVDSSAGGYRLSVDPVAQRWVVFASPPSSIFYPWSWRIRDRSSDALSVLSKATLPADMRYLDWPAWYANGRDMLFVTGATSGPEGMHKSPGQIWRLDNVLEYKK